MAVNHKNLSLFFLTLLTIAFLKKLLGMVGLSGFREFPSSIVVELVIATVGMIVVSEIACREGRNPINWGESLLLGGIIVVFSMVENPLGINQLISSFVLFGESVVSLLLLFIYLIASVMVYGVIMRGVSVFYCKIR